VAPEHVRERIARLEMATRFRPLHMQTLLLASAPPPALSDFFYQAEGLSAPAGWAGDFFRAVMMAAGIHSKGKSPQACLLEFQRLGCYLAFVQECPAGGEGPGADAGATLARRIRFSYKAKNVLALDGPARTLLQALPMDSLGPARVMSCSVAIPAAAAGSSGEWSKFAEALAEQLRALAG